MKTKKNDVLKSTKNLCTAFIEHIAESIDLISNYFFYRVLHGANMVQLKDLPNLYFVFQNF